MTVQQQIAERVMNLSDEGAELVQQLLNGLNPLYFVGSVPNRKDKPDVARRFGAGKGIIIGTDAFDSMNEEIAELFKEFD